MAKLTAPLTRRPTQPVTSLPATYLSTGGGSGPAIPFTYDTDTYFWDFTSGQNTIEPTGTATLALAPDLIANKAKFGQVNKSMQPLSLAAGINFNSSTTRVLTFDAPPTLTNGKPGWYVAFTVTFGAANGTIMQITRAASTAASRMYLDLSASRNLRLRFGDNDNASLTTVFTTAALTLGLKYAIEVLLDTVADTVTLWINGVQQSITVTGPPFVSFPATNPLAVLVGNTFTGSPSLDAVLNNIVFQDGLPPSDIRTTVSAFQQTRQQAA